MNPIADLRVVSGAFELDSTIRTAVEISLLSYARAQDGDPIPAGANAHGWWGDAYADQPGDSFGSRLWTLVGLAPAEIIERAPGLAEEALQWLIDDGLVSAVAATATPHNTRGVALLIEIS